MRTRLLSHYEIAQLVERRNPKTSISRQKMAAHIADAILDEAQSMTNQEKANVLTCHELGLSELLNINHANALRRQAHRYIGKRY
jgi:hypothetical protein